VKILRDTWVSTGGSNRVKSFSLKMDRAAAFLPDQRYAVQGIAGYSCYQVGNIRIGVQNYAFDDANDQYNLEVKTWLTTRLFGAKISAFFYNHVPDCATIFAECDFQGQSLEICSGQPISDFEEQAWGNKPVKSVAIPFKRTLTLYDKTGLAGPFVQVHNNVTCVEGSWTFSE